ncbi:MAG: OmpA family protein, partial [Acidimicrobiales bacterium]
PRGLVNRRRGFAVIFALVAFVVLANVVGNDSDPTDSPAAGSEAAALIASVREAEGRAGYPTIQVEVAGDIVTLFGTVATESDRTAARAVARSVISAGKTLTDELTVEGADTTSEAITIGPVTDAALALQHRLSALLARDPIVFGSASAEIAEESVPVLDEVVAELASDPSVSVLIAGHTDADGDEEGNVTLSQARAETVLAYFVASGIDAARLSAQGFGEGFPISDNETKEGKAANRRIEILVQP